MISKLRKMNPVLRTEDNGTSANKRYQKFSTITDFIQKWSQIIAVIAGAGWAYYQFVLGGADDWMVNLDMATETVPYKDNLRVLVVHLKSKNPTNYSFDFDKKHHAVYKLTVRKISNDLKPNALIDPSDPKISKGGEVVLSENLLPDDGYSFVPHSEFDDTLGIVLPVDSTVSVHAKWERSGDVVSISRIVHIDEH